MAIVRQPSFSAGELAPTLRGRTDLDVYGRGARTIRNFFVSKHGAAVSRPGLRYVAACKDVGVLRHRRLFGFVYSDSSGYVLEFGHEYVRIYFGATGALVDEVVTTYASADLAGCVFAQVGDVVYIVHPEYVPRRLTREAHATWTIADVELDPPAAVFPNLPAVDLELSGDVWPVDDGEHPEKVWGYRVTCIFKDALGRRWETAPYEVVHTTNGDHDELVADGGTRTQVDITEDPLTFAVYPDDGYHIKIDWGASNAQLTQFLLDLLADGIVSAEAVRVYRGRGQLFGLIGQVEFAKYLFEDDGREPDFTITPPKGGSMLDASGTFEEPRATGFFEGRQVYAGSTEHPNRIWLSGSNNYSDFDSRDVPVASGAVEIDLANRKREEIRQILGLDKLLVFTDASVWAVEGGDGPIAPTGINVARVQSEHGAANVPPIVLDESVLYVRAGGRGVRDLAYSNERGAYAGGDVSAYASHLFDEGVITSWAYSSDPWGVVWAVRNDGVLLSLTYDPRLGVWAWATHETGAATDDDFEDVCIVPTSSGDEVWFVVNRTINGTVTQSLERFATRVVPDSIADVVCLDAAMTLTLPADAALLTGGNQTVNGLAHLEGREVYALVDGLVQGPFTVSAAKITLTSAVSSKVTVGLRYDCDLELLDLAEALEKKKIAKRVLLDVVGSRGMYVGESLPAVGTVSGLTEWQSTTVTAAYTAKTVATDRAEVRISGTWNSHGRAVVRQFWPFPLTVLGFARDLEVSPGG